jgi:putative inorganic carbon (hco3(-)) transporter
MPFKTVLYLLFFGVASAGSLFTPLAGIMGYMFHYCLGPETSWWFAPIRHWGIRYSYTLALLTAIGVAINWGKLRFGNRLLIGQEKAIVLFLVLIWVLVLLGPETIGRNVFDHPSLKFAKIFVFLMLLTHVVTTNKSINAVLWVMVAGVLILGVKAYELPRSAFNEGRLETIGGPDFAEANSLAAFLVATLPLVAIQFVKSRLPGKILCAVTIIFSLNTVVLTRSRGATVAFLVGLFVAPIIAPRRYRFWLAGGVIFLGLSGLYLADEQFLHRAQSIARSEEQMGGAARSRLEIWRGTLKMIADHPLGVGPANFYQTIGRYSPAHEGRDAHNTILKSAAELGIPGMLLYLYLVFNAIRMTFQIRRRMKKLSVPSAQQVALTSYAIMIGLITILVSSLTMSLLYAEFMWWLIALPVCLVRAADNLELQQQKQAASAAELYQSPSEGFTKV